MSATRTEDLKAYRNHLIQAVRHVTKSQRGVVLSRDRRAKTETAERALFDLIEDVDDDLRRRGAAWTDKASGASPPLPATGENNSSPLGGVPAVAANEVVGAAPAAKATEEALFASSLPSSVVSKEGAKEPWTGSCSHDPGCATELEHLLVTEDPTPLPGEEQG